MSADQRPLITVITVCYNSERFLEDAINSVLSQKFDGFEYLIIDGNSKDRTLQIIESAAKRSDRIRYLSEPDKGIYDAMNKGIKLAKGMYIGFLNSDDIYAHDLVLQKVSEALISRNADFVYGDLVYVSQENTENVIRQWTSKTIPKSRMKFGWHPPHPTFYAKSDILREINGFNTNYRISADYALMLEIIEKKNLVEAYVPEVLVRMRVGGESNKSLQSIVKQNFECFRSWKELGLSPSLLLIPIKIFRKLLQFVHA